MHTKEIIPIEKIEQMIIILRSEKVMLDTDLARIYGTTTKRLNEQVRRNKKRFPSDFMFKLTRDEKAKVVANCDHLSNLKYSPYLPNAFTEHGAVMLASILNTEIAINTSIQIVRAFIKLREYSIKYKVLADKIEKLEKKYDTQFKSVFEAIKQLMLPPVKEKKKIGF